MGLNHFQFLCRQALRNFNGNFLEMATFKLIKLANSNYHFPIQHIVEAMLWKEEWLIQLYPKLNIPMQLACVAVGTVRGVLPYMSSIHMHYWCHTQYLLRVLHFFSFTPILQHHHTCFIQHCNALLLAFPCFSWCQLYST